MSDRLTLASIGVPAKKDTGIVAFFKKVFARILSLEFWENAVERIVNEAFSAALMGVGNVLVATGKSNRDPEINNTVNSQNNVWSAAASKSFTPTPTPTYSGQTYNDYRPATTSLAPKDNANPSFPGFR